MRIRQRGMTLIEIMIVLAIIALVMGLVVGPKVMDHFRDARRRTATLAVKRYANQDFPVWSVAHPSEACPPSLGAISTTETTTDPWGTDYAMHCGESAPPVASVAFGASSNGDDRVAKTTDDIVSWQ